MGRTRLLHLASLLALALLLGGCAVGYYVRDRVYDVPDVVDLKYGGGFDTMGLGLKLEVTGFFGTGLGYGGSDDVTEWRGRRKDVDDMTFLHVLLLGRDGPTDRPANYFFLWNVFYYSPMSGQWRIGAEVLLPLVEVGAYVNIGEIVDLVGGLFGADPMGDDGLPFGVPLEHLDV